jgi:hypothetical protein
MSITRPTVACHAEVLAKAGVRRRELQHHKLTS